MRMIFGLAGLLITIGIIVWIMKSTILPYDQSVISQGKHARAQAAQFAGKDEATGGRVADSITLSAETSGSKVGSILVTALVPGGPMQTYFGLQRDDSITAVNGLDIRDFNDGELSKAMVLEAYQRKQTLTVIRGGQELVLPQPATANAAPAPAQTAAPVPAAAPAAARSKSGQPSSPLSSQLDAIQAVPTH
jgi:hypothetical protein